MTTIFYVEPELVIALGKKVIFVNPNDLQIFKEVELPEDLSKCGLKLPSNQTQSEEEVDDEGKQKKKQNATPAATQPTIIQQVRLSPNRLLLAITTAGGQKAVLLYQCRPEHAKLISVRALPRAASTLTFSSDSQSLLVVDKTGDCHQYDCKDVNLPPRVLLGHLSIVFDVIWTQDSKYIITCDRDDKIRVTNCPATYDIHGYCLGHKEFVSGLALLADEVIASVSGDKTLRLWNYQNGRELVKQELPAPGIRLVVRRIDNTYNFQAAVLLHQPEECVALYELQEGESEQWHIEEQNLLKFTEINICNLCFVEDRLYVVGTINERLSLKTMALGGNTKETSKDWLEMVEEQFKEEIWQPENIDDWFKKHYDNVSDYLQRKKRRMEEKQK